MIAPDPSDSREHAEFRTARRLSVPPMYTLCRVKPLGEARFQWSGFVYDISTSGMRFELDQALAPGTTVDVHAMLPGDRHVTFNATGRVVRLHDDADERGPMRMGMTFDQFETDAKRRELAAYVEAGAARRAA